MHVEMVPRGAGCRRPVPGWVLLLVLASASLARAEEPDWVGQHGVSRAFPRSQYVTGYAVASGGDRLARAREAATADLARKITVRIESRVDDVSIERDGDHSYKVAAVTRSSTDVQLTDLGFERPYEKRGKVHVLAWIDRRAAAREQRAASDRALARLVACVEVAESRASSAGKQAALDAFEGCRIPIAEALQHDAVASALASGLPADSDPRGQVGGHVGGYVEGPAERRAAGYSDRVADFGALVAASARLDTRIATLRGGPARDLSDATDSMARSLTRQGVSSLHRIAVSHFSYGATNLSSGFGRQVGLDLQRALASQDHPVASRSGRPGRRPADLAVRGAYLEEGDEIRLSAIVREAATGRLVASAEARLPRASVPAQLGIAPANLEQVLREQRVLREGEQLSSGLRVEIWTDKGRGGVLYSEGEELRLYVRVNRDAWVRLLYVLPNGAKVPIDQGYHVDAAHVNKVVAYPDSFAVVPPFGIEMIHATAFTAAPPPLAVVRRMIDGQRYDVVAGGLRAVVRTRGIYRQQNVALAEDVLTVTTTPR
jgi:hypothetical protein